ncbi:hypothetical protein TNCV_3658511 [Trichonephila clavipes]|nr:hypothetical protein TNCV_3658511 [Trichonephila clavipes]
MTNHNHLNESLRWRAVGSLEAGQSKSEVARWLQMTQKLAFDYGINSRQVVLSQRRWKIAPQLARDHAAVSGRRISRQSTAVLQRLDFTSSVQSRACL